MNDIKVEENGWFKLVDPTMAMTVIDIGQLEDSEDASMHLGSNNSHLGLQDPGSLR